MTSGTAGAGSGLAFVDCGMSAAVGSLPEGRRRGVAVKGRRIRTIDIHAHCAVPEALALMGHKLEGPQNRPDLDMATTVSLRMKLMDQQAIDHRGFEHQSQLVCYPGPRSRGQGYPNPERAAGRSLRKQS